MGNKSVPQKTVVKAMCLIEHNGKLLLNKGYDSVKNETFFRIIGGGINFGEKSEEAVRREVREELNSEIENPHFLTVIENIFIYEEEKGHEVTLLYKADLLNKGIYKKESIPTDNERFPAEWVSISNILKGKAILYPLFDYKKLFSELF